MIANKDSDIAGVDVSDMTDMSNLFRFSDFSGSWTADLSGWDTSKVENMCSMFAGCKNLKEVSLPNTENVTDMSFMFYGCTNLKEVNLPHTENVTDIRGMFYGCEELTKVDLPHTENVNDMRWMFYGCRSLQQDFSNWNIEGKDHRDTFKDSGVTKFPYGYK